eukprot:14642632-Alexandrium_andersonii.AAC.1
MLDRAGRAPVHALPGARQTESPTGELPAHLEKQRSLRGGLRHLRGAVVLARRSPIDDTRSQRRPAEGVAR